MVNKKIIITLTGPSGSGKSTLEQCLVASNVGKRIIGFTTREPRKGEVNGVDVNFITREEAERLIKSPDITQFVDFKGNLYGKTIQDVESALSYNGIGIAVVEPSGIAPFRKYADNNDDTICISYYLTASTKTLVKRMLIRIKNDEEPNLDYYADRAINLLWEELKWERIETYRRYLMNEQERDLQFHTQTISDDIIALRCAYK